MSVKKLRGDEPKPRIEDVLADELVRYIVRIPARELRFMPGRLWAFDLAYPTEKLAIEIEGRHHLKHIQHRKDAEKMNAALAAGWRVLRYPASSVMAKSRRGGIVEQISRVLCGVHIPELDADLLTGRLS